MIYCTTTGRKNLKYSVCLPRFQKKCQGPAIFSNLKCKARETILAEIKPINMSKDDDDVDTITASLDKLYVKNKSASTFNVFENFSHFRRPSNMSIKDNMVDFNLRLCKIRPHAMDLPEDVLAYYLLSCANLSDEQTALCSNESSTSTYTTQIGVKAETQYLAQYDELAYYYEEDHDGEEVENVETEDTYYNRPGTWPGTSGGTCVAAKPMGRLKNIMYML